MSIPNKGSSAFCMSVIRSMLKRLEVYLGGNLKSLNRNDVDRQHLLFKMNLAIVN